MTPHEHIATSGDASFGARERPWHTPGDGGHPAGNALDFPPGMLRELGEAVLKRMEGLISSLPERPVAPDATPGQIRALLPGDALPERGEDPLRFVSEAADLLLQHSTFNGHPRFFGYITSSAAPIGAVADLLASAVNANVGAWPLAPMATEIEAQTIRWLAGLIGYTTDCGGLLVSGGNVANITCALAARTARAGWDIRRHGLQHPHARPLAVYATGQTHTWIEKAMDIMGLGTNTIRHVPTDDGGRMRPAALREAIAQDVNEGIVPMMVVATAGTVSTGAIDPIREIAAVCRTHGAWLHVDGAYGAPAAALPDGPDDLHALAEADSIALDPHKWLCAPLEAGCALVRNPAHLRNTFSYKPPYYHFDGEERLNYHDWGLQNSRGFRALKVWFILRQLGRSGCEQLIRENIALAAVLHRATAEHPLLEALTLGLSISTFRFVPADLQGRVDDEAVRDYLNRLNENLLTALQQRGRVYLSNAVLDGRFVLRACIVNFRTREEDVRAVPDLVAEVGEELDAALRSPLQKDRALEQT